MPAADSHFAFIFAGQRHRHDETSALGRKHILPLRDEFLVGPVDRADVAVEVIETEQVDLVVVLAKGNVLVDLILRRIPGKADHRTLLCSAPAGHWTLLPEPLHRLVARRPFLEISFGVHDRELVALVVLASDLVISEHVAEASWNGMAARPLLTSCQPRPRST